jgi:hypothetical protein
MARYRNKFRYKIIIFFSQGNRIQFYSNRNKLLLEDNLIYSL